MLSSASDEDALAGQRTSLLGEGSSSKSTTLTDGKRSKKRLEIITNTELPTYTSCCTTVSIQGDSSIFLQRGIARRHAFTRQEDEAMRRYLQEGTRMAELSDSQTWKGLVASGVSTGEM